jgi:dTDP-4-amino-4,6-dideoxygalactose transaminase
MEIPFHKPYITEDEVTAVVSALQSGWITMGPATLEFENRFKEYIGCKNAVSANSCTACLHLALKAINLAEGEEVLVPAITFTATAEVITYFNARPVLIDIDIHTGNIDFSKIEAKITGKTRAIMPVHYAGQPCDMEEIVSIAKKYNLCVIEDAAHAVPAWYRQQKIGTIGDMTCFSFYATKPLTTGEGGMVTTENDEWSERIKILRLHGISQDAWKRYSKEGNWFYEVIEAGYKYNLTDLQAAIGLSQLRKIDWMWQRRKAIARHYTDAFQSVEALMTPYVKPDRDSSWHLYVLRLNLQTLKIERNQFVEELKKRGVLTSVHFIPLYRHPFYRNAYSYSTDGFDGSEWFYERVISLPIYPGMTDTQVYTVIDIVRELATRYKK